MTTVSVGPCCKLCCLEQFGVTHCSKDRLRFQTFAAGSFLKNAKYLANKKISGTTRKVSAYLDEPWLLHQFLGEIGPPLDQPKVQLHSKCWEPLRSAAASLSTLAAFLSFVK